MAFRLNATADINTHIQMAQNAGAGVINPETFYSKQLLDTIRYDASQYVYFRLADESPISDKSDKLMVRRWAPLQAHTVPLDEGVPPKSDKGSVEKYEIAADQYGRYMEFTDKVDFKAVDPIIAHYTKEYSLVVMETFDMLARETLFSIAQKQFSGGAANFEALRVGHVPTLTDLRLIVLSLKKALVKPRANGRFHVIASPEFYYDMINDPIVASYMTINQSTYTLFNDVTSVLVPLFGMEFYETLICPTHSEYIVGGVLNKRMYQLNIAGTGYNYASIPVTHATVSTNVDGYVNDSRTGDPASYIPGQTIWDTAAWSAANLGLVEGGNTNEWYEFKVQHVLVIGKDALTRTGLAGEGQAKMYVKQKGSSGVLDPIDQRQSIGFKVNSVGFGSTRLEAVVDYICVPTQVNPI